MDTSRERVKGGRVTDDPPETTTPAATLPPSSPPAAADSPTADVLSSSDDVYVLSAEVVDLLYTQAFSPGELSTESDICKAFSNILLRHWRLCCLISFLRSDAGQLRESFVHTHPHLDAAKALRAGALLAALVERTEREQVVWVDAAAANQSIEREAGGDNGQASGEVEHAEVRGALVDADLKGGVAVPIHARGGLVGVLVAVSADAERLRAALKGVRYISAPIVIAIGNARRATAMNEQRHRIEQLYEELQQRGLALEEANHELRRIGRYRSLFLARMSHDLRTPLTSILGFTEILIDQEHLTDAQRRFCEKIQSSGLQLQASLNQLVDLSRLEGGQTELFLHEFSLREMLRESCAVVGRLAKKQKVEIECCTAPQIKTIVSDEGKLRQVLYNFLAHAIGRSPAGACVRVRAAFESPARFHISIDDQGEPLRDPAHIFEPVDLDANERGTNMNELGLVIAYRLMSVLGGSVALETDAPRGLTVRLEFPTRPTD